VHRKPTFLEQLHMPKTVVFDTRPWDAALPPTRQFFEVNPICYLRVRRDEGVKEYRILVANRRGVLLRSARSVEASESLSTPLSSKYFGPHGTSTILPLVWGRSSSR
jgi:hypothetical protein